MEGERGGQGKNPTKILHLGVDGLVLSVEGKALRIWLATGGSNSASLVAGVPSFGPEWLPNQGESGHSWRLKVLLS